MRMPTVKIEELNLSYMKNRILFFGVIVASQLIGAPSKTDIHYELHNLQSELQIVFERMETQENVISVLRQEIENT